MARRKVTAPATVTSPKPTKYYFAKDLKTGHEVEGSAYILGLWYSRAPHHSDYRVITLVRETGECYDSAMKGAPSAVGTLSGCLARVKEFWSTQEVRLAKKEEGDEWANAVLYSIYLDQAAK